MWITTFDKEKKSVKCMSGSPTEGFRRRKRRRDQSHLTARQRGPMVEIPPD